MISKKFLIALCIVGALMPVGNTQALLNSGGGNWMYYKEIIINNSEGMLSDYQILVDMKNSYFPLNASADGADIRFTDGGGAELAYWIESWDYANSSALVWIKVPKVPVGKSSIKILYGNAEALSMSNGTATFDFFDNFEDGIIDSSKWQEYDLNGATGSAIETDGILKLSVITQEINPPVIPSVQKFQDGILEFKSKVVSFNNVPHIICKFRYDGVSSVEATVRGYGDLYLYDRGVLGDTPYEYLDKHLNEWHFMQVKFSGKEAWLFAKNLATGLDGFTSSTISTTKANPIGLSVWNSISENHFDDVRVRKYASSEPTILMSDEKSTMKPKMPGLETFLVVIGIILAMAFQRR